MRQLTRITLVAAVAVAALSTTEVRASAPCEGEHCSIAPDEPERAPETAAPTAAPTDAVVTDPVSVSPDEPEKPPQTDAVVTEDPVSVSPDEPEKPPQTDAPTPASVPDTTAAPVCEHCSFSPDEPERPPQSDAPTPASVPDTPVPGVSISPDEPERPPQQTDAPAPPSVSESPAPQPSSGCKDCCITCEQIAASICLAGSFFAALLSNEALKAALLEALRRDLASCLSISNGNITISDATMTSKGLVVLYQVVVGDRGRASEVQSTAASLSTSGAAMPEVTRVYSSATGNSNVTVSDSSASDATGDSQASSAWRLSGVVAAVFTVALGAYAL